MRAPAAACLPVGSKTARLDALPRAGSLPATWANGDRPLRALTLLDLSGNALSGTLPDGPTDWGTGSRWGSPFPRLKTLNLDGNTLEGACAHYLRGFDLLFGALTLCRYDTPAGQLNREEEAEREGGGV